MVARDGNQLSREYKEVFQVTKPQTGKQVSPLRQRMIRDMELAGLTRGTQQNYIGAVIKLQNHYTIRPDRLSEEQVLRYVLWLRDERRLAKGTFLTNWHGLKFFYYRTLGLDWPHSALIGRYSRVRKSANLCVNGYPCPLPGRTAAG
jgi:hypothetical protein